MDSDIEPLPNFIRDIYLSKPFYISLKYGFMFNSFFYYFFLGFFSTIFYQLFTYFHSHWNSRSFSHLSSNFIVLFKWIFFYLINEYFFVCVQVIYWILSQIHFIMELYLVIFFFLPQEVNDILHHRQNQNVINYESLIDNFDWLVHFLFYYFEERDVRNDAMVVYY